MKTASAHQFNFLIFDLDDTLLDTYGQLVPQASREACEAMISSGLNATIAQCLATREEIAQTEKRIDLFENMTAALGVRTGVDPYSVALSGFKAFYDRKVEKNISLFPGARETLKSLKETYSLHLVTAGHHGTQSEKLKILQLEPLFNSVTIVDTFAGQTKSKAFHDIQSKTGARPEAHLSIGNRLDTDIAPAKALNWSTCWVKYGEYARSKAANALERPDFTIESIQELVPVCRL